MSGIRKWTMQATILVLLTTLATMAFAKINFVNKNSGTINFVTAVRVGTADLPAGEYKVSWTGPGDDAQVTFKQGNTTATAKAKIVGTSNYEDSYATSMENGARVLRELQFGKTSLVLNPAPGDAAGS